MDQDLDQLWEEYELADVRRKPSKPKGNMKKGEAWPSEAVEEREKPSQRETSVVKSDQNEKEKEKTKKTGQNKTKILESGKMKDVSRDVEKKIDHEPARKPNQSEENTCLNPEKKEDTVKVKKKTSNAAVAAIKRMQEAMKQQEEEFRRQEEEERRKEEERHLEEERKHQAEEAQRQLRRERRKAREAALKKEGTKTERQRLKRDREKLAVMLGSAQALDQARKFEPPSLPVPLKDSDIKKSAPISGTLEIKNTSKPTKPDTITTAAYRCKRSDGVLDSWEDALDTEDEPTTLIADLSISKENNESIEDRLKEDELVAPILCVLGHVDTGKTKLLDKLRETSVQENEAGGITQQIGATFFPREAIIAKMSPAHGERHSSTFVKVPGLIVIDTPGHASFTNLRSRGSSLCHLAILVVDIMHGLEPQTLESIELLRMRKTPFLIALNKIDRLYGWLQQGGLGWASTLAAQPESTREEFNSRLERIRLELASQASLNSILFTENKHERSWVSIVPISAITGDGIPDLLYTLVGLCQQRLKSLLVRQASSDENIFSASVLEVKNIDGLGTVIDVILTRGTLCPEDRIVVAGLGGPILTQVRSILTPEPMREFRVKTQRYLHLDKVQACAGVRLVATGLESAVAGSPLFRVSCDDQIEQLMAKAQKEVDDILGTLHVNKEAPGVTVQASTLGSLEALLSFLRENGIPVASATLGDVFKRDVMAAGTGLERWGDSGNAREFAVILAFNVKVDREAQELADEMGIKIFCAEIIYHLLDNFRAHQKAIQEGRKRDLAPQAIFPCVLRIVPGCIFNKRSPIIIGVQVTEGILRIGTPLVALAGDNLPVPIGRVSSIELNHRPIDKVRRGGPSVAIKVDQPAWEVPRMVGRHFHEKDELVSALTRSSLDVLKTSFREEMSTEDWQLARRLKPLLGIP